MQTNDAGGDTERKYQIRVLPKALAVLESVVSDGPATLTDLTKSTGTDKAAVYRIINTLRASDYVAKDESTKRYRPGPKLIGLARAVIEGVDLVQKARPYLVELVNKFSETVNLGTMIDGEIQYLDVLDSPQSLRMTRQPGMHDQVHCTALGKAILSTFTEDSAEDLLRSLVLEPKTERTLTEIPALLEELAHTRRRGYAIDDQENDLGAVCVGAPITGLPYGGVAALSVSGPAARMTGPVVLRISEELTRAAGQIAAAMGVGVGPPLDGPGE